MDNLEFIPLFQDDLPLSDNDAPSKPVVVTTASMKPTVVGGMNVDISDEEEEEESEWEKEKQLQDQVGVFDLLNERY